MSTSKKEPQKKRHHFVPKAYLKAFCGESGRLYVYRKDLPSKALPLQPDSTQFRTYYYSQPTPDGGQDNNTLENLFSTVESEWPTIVEALHQRKNVNDQLQNIFEFIALQRARVPAARDMAEAMNAQFVKMTFDSLYESGKLPPFPGDKKLVEDIQISIDPHRSIHAMPWMLQGMAKLFDVIGLAAIHNQTDVPFLTSDNPVIWFDPAKKFSEQLPYTVDLSCGEILLIFPVSPKLIILGSKDYCETYSRFGIQHGEMTDPNSVNSINAQVCRFAYEAVISSTPGQEDLVTEFSDESPILECRDLTIAKKRMRHCQQVFGKRPKKPKWEPG